MVIENLNSENITYKKQPENDLNGKICTLHRNMLLPCDNLLDNYDYCMKCVQIRSFFWSVFSAFGLNTGK